MWRPATTFGPTELEHFTAAIDGLNAARRRPLTYGYFSPDRSAEWRQQFLTQSIWCLVEDETGPLGFAYHFELGLVAGRPLVHAGLVQLNRPSNRNLVLWITSLLVAGNLRNFGPYVTSSITHVPMIANLFHTATDHVYPTWVAERAGKRDDYEPFLDRLVDAYIVEVLGVAASSVCRKSYRIRGSLAKLDSGFVNRWDALPDGSSADARRFMEQHLAFDRDTRGRRVVQDDLIQIGTVDHDFCHREPFAPFLDGW